MADTITQAQRSALMSRIPNRNTKPELRVRRLLHALGYRFRLHARELPGSPDIVLRPRKAAIFVHGCFWHGHECRHRQVKSNGEYWAAKISRNRQRDSAAQEALISAGWRTLTVWECELPNEEAVTKRLKAFLDTSDSPHQRRPAGQ